MQEHVFKKLTFTDEVHGKTETRECDLEIRRDGMCNGRTLAKTLGKQPSHMVNSAPMKRFYKMLRDEGIPEEKIFHIDDEGVPRLHWRLWLFVLATFSPQVADNNIEYMAHVVTGNVPSREFIAKSRRTLLGALSVDAKTRALVDRLPIYSPVVASSARAFGGNGVLVAAGAETEAGVVVQVLPTDEERPALYMVMDAWLLAHADTDGSATMLAIEFKDDAREDEMTDAMTLVEETLTNDPGLVCREEGTGYMVQSGTLSESMGRVKTNVANAAGVAKIQESNTMTM